MQWSELLDIDLMNKYGTVTNGIEVIFSASVKDVPLIELLGKPLW